VTGQLAAHADAVKQSIVRPAIALGWQRYSHEEVKTAGGKLHILQKKRVLTVGLSWIAAIVVR
jgi:hypothetical protein